MKTLNLVQGSPEWLAARRTRLCASDAPAMMGASKYVSRSELVRMRATGDEREVDAHTQALFDRGHDTEAAARAIVEEMIGEELYPVTGESDDGRLLASYDGLTMAGDTGFEHKLWNEELAAAIRAGDLPPAHHWQVEQQILIGGLERVIFVCSDGTRDKFVHLEYRAVPGRAKELLAGWDQFEKDVADYQHVEVAPAASGRVIPDLPALLVQTKGEVVSSNLAEFKVVALHAIRSINTDLQTDQDFADADKAIKFCDKAEGQLEAVKAQALGQQVSIAELFSTMDLLKAEMREKRLSLEKLVKARKEARRAEILRSGQDAVAAHMKALNDRLGKPYMPAVPVDFAKAMHGKKAIASMLDGVNVELARWKIAANEIADRIGVNLNLLREKAADHAALFADAAQIVLKAPDDFATLVDLRITQFKTTEEKRLEAQRAAIRVEEEAKARAEAERKVREEAAAAAAATKAPEPAAPAAVAPAPPAPPAAPAAPARNVVPLRAVTRPTDAQILEAISTAFGVDQIKALEWIRGFDHKAAAARLAGEAFATNA